MTKANVRFLLDVVGRGLTPDSESPAFRTSAQYKGKGKEPSGDVNIGIPEATFTSHAFHSNSRPKIFISLLEDMFGPGDHKRGVGREPRKVSLVSQGSIDTDEVFTRLGLISGL